MFTPEKVNERFTEYCIILENNGFREIDIEHNCSENLYPFKGSKLYVKGSAKGRAINIIIAPDEQSFMQIEYIDNVRKESIYHSTISLYMIREECGDLYTELPLTII